jgi:hypothetical protein
MDYMYVPTREANSATLQMSHSMHRSLALDSSKPAPMRFFAKSARLMNLMTYMTGETALESDP